MTAHVLLTSKGDVGGLEYNAVGQRNVLYPWLLGTKEITARAEVHTLVCGRPMGSQASKS
jgi:hypothetical protein